ncbi:unnamed protein product [Urochloa humidicola]
MAGAEEAGARQGMAAGAEEVAAAAKSSNQGVEQIRSDVGISAYSWLKEDIENVVVVDCKAGKARTGLMISSLLLFLKFFPTAEESIEYCNQKRCVDGKGFILPSQIRYVKYFERILTYFNGENQPPRRCSFLYKEASKNKRINDFNKQMLSISKQPNLPKPTRLLIVNSWFWHK